MRVYMDGISLLKDLIRINTANPPGEEGKMARYLEEIFEQEQIPCLYQETAPERGNLLAWLRANGEVNKPPLIFLSHMDVVGAQEEQWKYPPFAAREVDGYIYGRGTVDTKQLTVMELMAFLALKKEGIKRCRDVYFLATADEESGSALGLQYFLENEILVGGEKRKGRDLFTNGDVISEGGGFPILAGEKELYLCETGQKSCGTVEFTVKARKSKGPFFGSGDGMERAMKLVQDIGNRTLEGAVLKTVDRFETAVEGIQLSPMMKKILSAMKRNSLTVTMITGKSVNEVKVTCDVRLIPGFGEAWLRSVLEELSRKWDCEYEILSLGKGYESDPEGELLGILEKSTREVRSQAAKDASLLPFVSMGSSDGRLLTGTGAKVYGYSPVLPWDMTFDSAVSMVHGVDERIHRDSVIFGSQVLTKAVLLAVGEEEQR